ncbi:MAG TPA: glycosyltransferase family A protein [Acidimicrobiales bacterium]|nr:glycosyltransferase family A protein [Acidimicrobiales bacterium]
MGETSAGGQERIRISVVVPARNAVDVLGAQLDALAAQEVPVPWEVVVADNGSTDGTRELAAAWHDRLPVRVVDASAHAGVNHARNRGVHAAHGELVLCCDADDVVAPGWVAAYWHTRDGWDMAGGFIGVDALNGPEALARHADVKYGGLNQFGWMPGAPGSTRSVPMR